MKKKILILFCLSQVVNILAQEREFTVNGKLPTSYYDGLTVYLNEIDYKGTNSVFKRDSITIDGDRFTFSGALGTPIAVRYITLADSEELSAIVIIEKGTIDIELSAVPQMSGTSKNNELKEFSNKQIKNQRELEEILEKAQSLHRTNALDASTSLKLEQDFNDQRELMSREVSEFVSKNILNEIGEFFFTIYASSMTPNLLEKLYASSREEFQQGAIVKSLMNKYVWSLGNLREGKTMKGIEMKNNEGKIEDISIHFGKGKVVLVDFWASWCTPCIKSMPAVAKVYERYKDSGFEIVGISLDESESSWRAAIKRHNMVWIQYIDDDGGRNGGAAAKEYGISQIPQTYLLDKKGKIAGHDLSGIALIEKIEELLKQAD